MAEKLKELARSLILSRCHLKDDLPLDFAQTKPLFIPIKNNQVSLSEEIESLEDAESCMLFFTYFRDNTVPDNYKKGYWVTFRNPYRGFGYIDSKGESHYWYLDDGFQIDGFDNTCKLKYNDNILMRVDVTEEGIQNLWYCYQIAKKCLKTQREELESAKSELESNFEALSNDYDKLKQRYEKIVGLIDKITQLTKNEALTY